MAEEAAGKSLQEVGDRPNRRRRGRRYQQLPARSGGQRMKADVALPCVSSLVRTRAADYLQLVRPRLALMVLVTVDVGWLLAAGGEAGLLPLVNALIGTALLFAGASALNQWLERDRDGLMPRTANRPLPAGRLRPAEVLALGEHAQRWRSVYLLALCPPLAAGLGTFALFSYLLVYTPLKERTTLSTLIGASRVPCRR